MQNLFDLLDGIAADFPDAVEGKNPNSGFGGDPLPSTRQYRAVVSRSEWRKANTSGKYSYSVTFEVTEPAEFAGKKFTEYYSIEEGANAIAREKFARLIGESGIDIKTADTSSNEAFAKEFEGKEFVIATRRWGDDMSNNGIRYLNRDRGQKLLDSIKPLDAEVAALKANKLKAEIQVNKREEEAASANDLPGDAQSEPEVEQAVAQAHEQVRLPGNSGIPDGIRLPPGLQQR